MIRFPPTSIALSDSDIDFHLREIQIKEQLYAQGFTRKEVQHYYSQRHGDIIDDDDDDVLSSRTPSFTFTTTKEEPAKANRSTAVTGEIRRASDLTSIRTDSFSENVRSSPEPTATPSDPLSSSPVSVPSSPPAMQISVPFRHAAVRQSSLLRIMHTAGSQPSTVSKSSSSDISPRDDDNKQDGSEMEPGDFLRSPATRMISYRPRSKTYTYIESEAEPPTPPVETDDERSNITPFLQFHNHSGGLTSESEEHFPQEWRIQYSSHTESGLEILSPLTLPPPSINHRTPLLQLSLPDRTRSSTPSIINQHDGPRQPSPLLPSNSPFNLARLDMTTINLAAPRRSLPSSPLDMQFISSTQQTSHVTDSMPGHFPSTPTRVDAALMQLSSSSPSSPQTPIRLPPQTEPRNASRHHLTGTFGVYNDRLPAETQPQTPADLQSPRRRAVVERNVAYTAPPGRVRTAGRLVGIGHDGGQGDGARSPTFRSGRMRERRAREAVRWRSVRMEALRGQTVTARGRGEDREDEGDDGLGVGDGIGMDIGTDRAITPAFASNRFGDMAEGEEQAERRMIRDWAQVSRSRMAREVDWRDEFDEDRVGSENFEGLEVGERRMGRVGDRRRVRRPTADEEDEEADDGVDGFTVLARTPEP